MNFELIVYGFVVGIALGLSGGGGSIFAMPFLVYGAGIPVHMAILISLIVVGSTAFFGSFLRIRNAEVHFRAAGVMILMSLFFAPAGAIVSQQLPGWFIMVGFGCLMVSVGLLMWRKAAREERHIQDAPSKQRHPLYLVGGGAVTGFLNGLFGVGGGFLIVPTLIFAAQLPIRVAMASSLLVIGSTSFISVITHIMQKEMVSMWIVGLFLLGGIIGMGVGTAGAKKLNTAHLHKGFALMVIIVGICVLIRELYRWA